MLKLIKDLPNDIKEYLKTFVFFRCDLCKNKLYLINEINICDNCNTSFCNEHCLIDTKCLECFGENYDNYLDVLEEFFSASCSIS